MKKILIAALFIVASLRPQAEAHGIVDVDCSDYYGLNICATSELSENQTTYVEETQNTFTTNTEKHGPLLSTSLIDENLNQINKENTFENSDAFRAYMKTLDNTDSANTDNEFSITKRILADDNFGLDCRVVTDTIYELSSSNYYDCALQRYF